MKNETIFLRIFILFIFLFLFFLPTQEAIGLTLSCEEKLNGLITPSLNHPRYQGKTILTEIESESNGVYLIRLFTLASSNEYPKTDLLLGWIRLDTRKMKAFDPTIDEENPTELEVNSELFTALKNECLSQYFVIEKFTTPLSAEDKYLPPNHMKSLSPSIAAARLIISTAALFCSRQAFSFPDSCSAELLKLLVPAVLEKSLTQEHASVWMRDFHHGIYGVKLYPLSDTQDDEKNPDPISWIRLDTNSMKVFDVTYNPDAPVELPVDMAQYRFFASNCLQKKFITARVASE